MKKKVLTLLAAMSLLPAAADTSNSMHVSNEAAEEQTSSSDPAFTSDEKLEEFTFNFSN